MTTDADFAKQGIQDELEFQIKAAKAELDVLANRAEGTMVQAEVEAYETLSPKLQAIQQKFQQLKKAAGAQWEQTKADLQVLIADLGGALATLLSLQRIGERGRVGRRSRLARAQGAGGAFYFRSPRATESHDLTTQTSGDCHESSFQESLSHFHGGVRSVDVGSCWRTVS